MLKDKDSKAAEHHEAVAKVHKYASEQQITGDDSKAQQQSKEARQPFPMTDASSTGESSKSF